MMPVPSFWRLQICVTVVLLAGIVPAEADNPAPSAPLTLSDLKRMSPCELEQVFARGTAVMPVCAVRGHVLCRVEGKLPRVRARLGGAVWKGKYFEPDADGYFINRWVGGIQGVSSCAFIEPSWFDKQPCVVLEHEPGTFAFGNTRDEFREVACGLYLGRFYQRRPCPLLQGYVALENEGCGRKAGACGH